MEKRRYCARPQNETKYYGPSVMLAYLAYVNINDNIFLSVKEIEPGVDIRGNIHIDFS
jgi:hypothetical protein